MATYQAIVLYAKNSGKQIAFDNLATTIGWWFGSITAASVAAAKIAANTAFLAANPGGKHPKAKLIKIVAGTGGDTDNVGG